MSSLRILFFWVVFIVGNSAGITQIVSPNKIGNNPLERPGAGFEADILQGYFGGSYHYLDEKRFSGGGTLVGLNFSGMLRNGMSSSFQENIAPSTFGAYLTYGYALSNKEVTEKNTKSVYKRVLKKEKRLLAKDSLKTFTDTAFIFDKIKQLPSEFSLYKDSLKQIYYSSSHTMKLFTEWRNYAEVVSDYRNSNSFLLEVEQLILDVYNNQYKFEYLALLKQELNEHSTELKIADKYENSYIRRSYYVDFGFNTTSFRKADFISHNGVDSSLSFGRVITPKPYLALGYYASYKDEITGVKTQHNFKIGMQANDNFEELELLQYDSTINTGNTSISRTQKGYYGNYNNLIRPFFSYQLNLLKKFKNGNTIVIAPIYITVGIEGRSLLGSSIGVYTKKNFFAGVNYEIESYSQRFGIRLGYFLSNSNFLR
jgi:hypothetical protein